MIKEIMKIINEEIKDIHKYLWSGYAGRAEMMSLEPKRFTAIPICTALWRIERIKEKIESLPKTQVFLSEKSINSSFIQDCLKDINSDFDNFTFTLNSNTKKIKDELSSPK